MPNFLDKVLISLFFLFMTACVGVFFMLAVWTAQGIIPSIYLIVWLIVGIGSGVAALFIDGNEGERLSAIPIAVKMGALFAPFTVFLIIIMVYEVISDDL